MEYSFYLCLAAVIFFSLNQMNKLKIVLTFVALIAIPVILFAQPAPDPPGGGIPCGTPPFGAVCPIDGGVSLLIAAGLALGGKKAFDFRRKSE